MKKKQAKQIAALCERAYSVLEETGLPFVYWFPTLGFVRISTEMEGRNFVILQEGSNTIYSNAEKRHAEVMVEDMAEVLFTCRTKTLEKNIEDALERGGWNQGEEGK